MHTATIAKELEMPMLRTVSVLAGTFYFRDHYGVNSHCDLYIRCEPDSDDPEVQSRRVDALNQQYMDAYDYLEHSGATRIRFTEVKPNPFF